MKLLKSFLAEIITSKAPDGTELRLKTIKKVSQVQWKYLISDLPLKEPRETLGKKLKQPPNCLTHISWS